MRVLGVDPGLTRCGVGVVEGVAGRPLTMLGVGVVRTPADAELGLLPSGTCSSSHASRPWATLSSRRSVDRSASERITPTATIRARRPGSESMLRASGRDRLLARWS